MECIAKEYQGKVDEKSRCGPTRLSLQEKPHHNIFVVTLLDVKSSRGKSSEVVELMYIYILQQCYHIMSFKQS